MAQNPDDPLSRSLIGKIAVGRGFLTEQELEEHRRSEQAAGGPLPLLEYLLEKKGLSPEQVIDLLRAKAHPIAEDGRRAEVAKTTKPARPPGEAGVIPADDDVLSIEPAGPAPRDLAESSDPAIAPRLTPSVTADDDPVLIEPAAVGPEGDADPSATTRRIPRSAPPSVAVSATSAPQPLSAGQDSASSAGPASATSAGYKMRFGYLAVRLGYVTPDQLGVALDTQKFLQKKGRPSRLGEVLVSQGILEGKHVLTLLKLQGKTLLRCGGCGTRFNAERFDPAHPLPCRKCGKPLAAAAPGDVADAPSAQGTFVNLPAVRGLDPSSFRAPETSLPVLPETAVPAVPLGRPVSSSRLRAVPGPSEPSEGRRVGESERPGVPIADAPTRGEPGRTTLQRSDVPTPRRRPAPRLPNSTNTATTRPPRRPTRCPAGSGPPAARVFSPPFSAAGFFPSWAGRTPATGLRRPPPGRPPSRPAPPRPP